MFKEVLEGDDFTVEDFCFEVTFRYVFSTKKNTRGKEHWL